MANRRVIYALQVADVDGNIASVTAKSFAPDAATLTSLEANLTTFATAVQAATNGKITRTGFSVLVDEAQILPGSTPPTDAEYPSVTDGARLHFSNHNGSTASITIPAPLGTVFLGPPQRDIVDPSGPAAGLIAWMKAIDDDADVDPLNLYQGGIKVGRSARKRRPPKAGL